MSDDVPIYKVGVVLLSKTATAEPQVLLVRPKPKDPSETDLPWVLPRGTREYKENGVMKPVKGDADAVKYADRLERVTGTLLREAEEEAGVPPQLLRNADVRQLGVRDYKNSRGEMLHIHWYVAALDDTQLLHLKPPTDALKPPYWENVSALPLLVNNHMLNDGYVPVAQEALSGIRSGKFDKVTIPESQHWRG